MARRPVAPRNTQERLWIDPPGSTTRPGERFELIFRFYGVQKPVLEPKLLLERGQVDGPRQAETFSTTVTTTSQVTVPPGYKGFTTTQVLSANATASYYITRGIHLIEVTGIDLTFPGYQDKQDSDDSQVIYNGVAEPINPVTQRRVQTRRHRSLETRART